MEESGARWMQQGKSEDQKVALMLGFPTNYSMNMFIVYIWPIINSRSEIINPHKVIKTIMS